MEPAHPPLAAIVRGHLVQLLEETGIVVNVPADELRAGLDHIQLGLGQLLADVERARIHGVPLNVAAHAHETFPYLSRFHGWLHDAFVMELPNELLPIMRRLVGLPPPSWTVEIHDSSSIIARTSLARPEERALATLLLFEGVRINLFMASYRLNGWWEAVGGCRRTLDDLAWNETAKVLAMPLAVEDDDMTFAVIVADAIHCLRARAEQLWATRELVDELRLACADRARAEMAFREADPVDAAVLRNYFDSADHQQPIPMSRLPLEHPLVLNGHDEDSLNQRSRRAIKKLVENVRRPRPMTLAALIIEMEDADA